MPRRNNRLKYFNTYSGIIFDLSYFYVNSNWCIRYYTKQCVKEEDLLKQIVQSYDFIHNPCNNSKPINERCDVCQEYVPKWLKIYAQLHGLTKDLM